MLAGTGLVVVLLFATPRASTSAPSCSCTVLPSAGLRVNCSSLELTELPGLPADLTELHAEDNRLTSVPSGAFDRLTGLRTLSLSGNPFHCDCEIAYLRNWLRKNGVFPSEGPTCAGPGDVARKAVADLDDEHFRRCGRRRSPCRTRNALAVAMIACVTGLLLWSLRLAKNSTITLYIDKKHSEFEADSLRSRKPKHRRRIHTEPPVVREDPDDGENALVRTDLLPQVLDALQKKHNIKIKVV